jgi:LysM repeat protein
VLAPIAFFAAATVLILIVQNSLEAGPEQREPAAQSPTTTGARAGGDGQTTPGATPARRRRFHRVRGGDTLESIAQRYDTTVEELYELNPDIDPLALSRGQRIRVR